MSDRVSVLPHYVELFVELQNSLVTGVANEIVTIFDTIDMGRARDLGAEVQRATNAIDHGNDPVIAGIGDESVPIGCPLRPHRAR